MSSRRRMAGSNLVALIDCHDRYLVGWRFSKSGKAGLSAGALEDALIREKIIPGNHGLVIRSDNGLVFGSKRFHETITKYKLTQEYITPYTPEQNGMIERFFRSFKEECAWQKAFTDFNDALQPDCRLDGALQHRTTALGLGVRYPGRGQAEISRLSCPKKRGALQSRHCVRRRRSDSISKAVRQSFSRFSGFCLRSLTRSLWKQNRAGSGTFTLKPV